MIKARVDRLSGMDVRAALRRTRLPLFASLVLAALLGVPATVPVPHEPVRISAHVVVGRGSAEVVTAEPAAADPGPLAGPVVAAPALVVRTVPQSLAGRAVRGALAPRAPPTA